MLHPFHALNLHLVHLDSLFLLKDTGGCDEPVSSTCLTSTPAAKLPGNTHADKGAAFSVLEVEI